MLFSVSSLKLFQTERNKTIFVVIFFQVYPPTRYRPRACCFFIWYLKFFRQTDGLEENLPNLNTLILTNNNIQELADLEQLSGMQNLEMISLLHNPVVSKPNYRLFVIHKFSNLRVLDFKKVKQKERDSAKELFKSKKGKEQREDFTHQPGNSILNSPIPI